MFRSNHTFALTRGLKKRSRLAVVQRQMVWRACALFLAASTWWAKTSRVLLLENVMSFELSSHTHTAASCCSSDDHDKSSTLIFIAKKQSMPAELHGQNMLEQAKVISIFNLALVKCTRRYNEKWKTMPAKKKKKWKTRYNRKEETYRVICYWSPSQLLHYYSHHVHFDSTTICRTICWDPSNK